MILSHIVIADDEPIQRRGLAKMVQKILPESRVSLCRNGEEVRELLKEQKADLLITDICMPEMDGLELSRIASEEYPELKVVLVSAYQEFEYARKGILYGVSDYLVKPFRQEDARKLILRMTEEIGREKVDRERIESAGKEEELKQLSDFLTGRRGSAGTVWEERLRGEGCVCVLCRKNLRRKQDAGFDKSLREAFPNTVLIRQPQGLNPLELKATLLFMEQGPKQVTSLLTAFFSMHSNKEWYFAGISSQCSSLLERSGIAVREAEEALSFQFYEREGGKVFRYDEFAQAMEHPMISLSRYENRLRKLVYSGERELAKEQLFMLKRALEEGAPIYPGKVRHRVSSMAVSILRELEGTAGRELYDALLQQAYERYGLCDSFEGLFTVTQELMDQAVGLCLAVSDEPDTVEKCMHYIREHLDGDLSLQTLADRFHFHPNYLSARIKEKAGLSCMAFIQNLRMEKATRLLSQTDLKIGAVAEQCGFKDHSYFIRVFRNQFHVSPERYRKVHRICQSD